MSGQTTFKPARPVTRAPVTNQTPEQAEWSAEFFRRKAWTSKKGAQIKLASELKDAIPAALGAMFQPGGPGSSASLSPLAGGHPLKHRTFKSYRAALEKYETARGGKDEAQRADALREAATDYIKHSEAEFEEDELDAKGGRRQRLDACQKTLDDLTRQAALRKMTTLPWDSETSMAAAGMKAELDLASLPQGQRFAAPLGADAGVNSSFWITKQSANNGAAEKSFLFKPPTDKNAYSTEGEAVLALDREGVPNGGEPAREALASRAADVLGAMTGIDFKFPETHIVAVGKERFEADGLGQKIMGREGDRPLVGSLQAFSPGAKEMRDHPPSMKHAVPAKRCQELAVLDIAMLHLDRHSGNFMMTGNEDAADLIPIDNGLSFPNTGLTDLSYMAGAHNALLSMPGAHEPFSPDMLAKLSKVDPKILKQALAAERDDMEAVHASSKDMITDEALDTSARSVAFLKLAAPTLPPALVQYALGSHAVELLNPTLDGPKFTAVAQRVIAQVAKDQKELSFYFTMTDEEREAGAKAIENAGWSFNDHATSPVVFVKLLTSGANKPKPAARAGDWDEKTTVPGRDLEKEIANMKQVFPSAPDKLVLKWIEFQDMGGMAAVEKAKNEIGMSADVLENYLSKPRMSIMSDYLARCNAVSGPISNIDPGAAEVARLKSKGGAVLKLIQLLEPTDQLAARTSLSQLLKNEQKLDSAKRLAALDKLRDQVVAKCQVKLRRELDGLPPTNDAKAKADRKDALNALQKGMVFNAREVIDTLRPAQAQSTNTASANPTPSPQSRGPNQPPRADASPDPEAVAKILDAIGRVRGKPGSERFKQQLDGAEAAARQGRVSDAFQTVKQILPQLG